ncbi:MAG: hypothetical protein AB8H80_12860 [Planctomycetota bacterium]
MRPLPHWFWLLPLLAIAAWWPIDPYWASDDFLALHYASDLGRAASDLVGPQYGATDVWLFYRPLITLSFWFDQLFAGGDPWFSHASNVLAHGTSALLAGLILRRFLPDGAAFLAALCWAIVPGHTGSIAWAVGRVDSHTVVWCLLALWLTVRAVSTDRYIGIGGGSGSGSGSNIRAAGGGKSPTRPAKRWPIAAATALALMSKELAFVVPALASIVAFAAAGNCAPNLRERLRTAAAVTWPAWLVFGLYLPFRLLVLGAFGGYQAASLTQLEPGVLAGGLGQVLLDTAAPIRWVGARAGGDGLQAAIPTWAAALACGLPCAIAVLVAIWRRPRAVAMLGLAFLIALAPMVAFLPAAHNPHNLRYYYLPSIALLGICGLGGRAPLVAILLAWLWPLCAMRIEQREADLVCQRQHQALLQFAASPAQAENAGQPLFVAGMPDSNRSGTAVQLHFGVDRMLAPPFVNRTQPLYPWRPALRRPDAVRLTADGAMPFALPEGTTVRLAPAGAPAGADASRQPRFGQITVQTAPEPPPLPELVIRGDVDGVLDITTDRLDPLIEDAKRLWANREPSFGLTFPGVSAPWLRVTLFTAIGYVSCVCQNPALPTDRGATAGANRMRLDVLRWLAGDGAHGIEAAFLTADLTVKIGDVLVLPTTHDLQATFPTLIEAGSLDPAAGRFVPSHRARRLIRFRFDRRYADWVRRVQGK